MNITPLSREYLEETMKMVAEVFPDDVGAIYNPERSFNLGLQYAEHPDLLANSETQRRLGYWIVLNESDEVVGTTGLYNKKDGPPDEVWLGWYCMRKDQRGKGLGRELLEWTVERARAEGYKKFKLYTSTDPNEARAQELYEKLGFKIIGEEDNDDGAKTLYREKTL